MGMMGSGKTSVGGALAQRTGWQYLDNDKLLERASGRTARELAERGEDALRRAERQALVEGLSVAPPVIVAAAAGIVLDPSIGEVLGDAFVVWLRASPATLASRATGGEHRPWLDGDARSWLERADAARGPAYGALASMEVRTDRVTAAQAADVIRDALAADGSP